MSVPSSWMVLALGSFLGFTACVGSCLVRLDRQSGMAGFADRNKIPVVVGAAVDALDDVVNLPGHTEASVESRLASTVVVSLIARQRSSLDAKPRIRAVGVGLHASRSTGGGILKAFDELVECAARNAS